MNPTTGTILFSLGLIYCLYEGYILWIKPKDYLKNVHGRRLRLKSQLPFLPDWFVGYIFFYEQPQVSLWGARIVLLFISFICIIGLIIGIRGLL